MRASQYVGGIKRIFPLIKQQAPDCITRLSSLSALPPRCRLAIDATLLVQRLHFSPDQHPDRHALGFSRLIRQLRDCELIPIMVFDNFGQQARLPAKSREQHKRRSQRLILALRAKLELQRAKRLRILQAVVEEYRNLRVEDKSQVTRLLSGWRDEDDEDRVPSRIAWSSDEGEQQSDILLSLSPNERGSSLLIETRSTTLEHILDSFNLASDPFDIELETNATQSVWDEIISTETEHAEFSEKLSNAHKFQMWDDSLWSHVLQVESSAAVRVAARLRSLRRQYGQHQARTRAADVVALDISSDWPKETAAQAQMTRSEGDVYRLIEEGVNDKLEVSEGSQQVVLELQHKAEQAMSAVDEEPHELSPTNEEERSCKSHSEASSALECASEEHPTSVLDSAIQISSSKRPGDGDHLGLEPAWFDIDSLSEKSAHMQRNYVRSSASLSQTVFETCAQLCEALDVPVLWTGSGMKGKGRPHEAEAMASMLVRHGYADVVASEDSDVLLYDVPLLRGLMGSKDLELVDSSKLRRQLFPPTSLPGSSTADGQAHQLAHNELSSDESDQGKGEDSAQRRAALDDGERAEELSRRQMLDFALLCGTDFNRTLPGIAAGRALKLIRRYGSIDGIRRASARQSNTSAIRHNRTDIASKQPVRKPSLLNTIAIDGVLRPPDELTWREYNKELTQARHVFENPPTLFWQLRKVRQLKEHPIEHSTHSRVSESRSAVEDLLTKGIKERPRGDSDETERRIDSTKREKRNAKRPVAPSSALHTSGLGSTPFGDGRRVSVWN